MGVTTTQTNKPFNPRGNDQSPKGYNRASLFSGKALDFDGVNDSVSVSYTEGIGGIWSWVSIIEFDSVSGYQELFGGQYGSTNATIYLKNTQLNFYTTGDNINTAFDFETGKKYHVACSQSGDTISVYVNGQSAGSVSLTAQLNRSSGAYTIGKHPVNSNEYLNGKISGVKLFNTALTAAQVADLYNNPEKVVPTGVDNTALKLWLPMMEGAGTTAYDGSGNGNHGTISGATYVNGIGAPVAQSAVMDWNKGQNYVKQSENFDNSDWAKYTSFGGTLNRTSNYAEAPDGSQTATRIEAAFDPNQSPSYGLLSTDASTSTSGNYIGSLWLKSNTGSSQNISMYVRAGINGSDILVTNEWQRVTKQGSGVNNYLTFGTRNDIGSADANIDILVWGASINYGTEVDSYVPTYGSGQESDVLLPQGLTTGRDITGVNLFENVRKQGALNLDGNSYAEVHDNASLDYSNEVTLETWIYWTGEDDKGILGRWHGPSNKRSLMLYSNTATKVVGIYSSTGSATAGFLTPSQNLAAGNWYHVAFTSDGSTIKIYIDGVEGNSASYSSGFYVSDENLEIGTYQTDKTKAHDAPIAQPRIYNRALTASEIQQNYNAGKNIYTN